MENNQYAYSTPTHQTTKVTDISQRAAGYGMPGLSVDGNDVEEVYRAAAEAIERARSGGGPTLIEAKTMRMLGHAIHDGAEYVPAGLLAEWEARDPVVGYAARLIAEARHRPGRARGDRRPVRGGGHGGSDVGRGKPLAQGRDGDGGRVRPARRSGGRPMTATIPEVRNLTYLAAITEALVEEMRRDPDVLVLGEDVGGEFGGAFKVTKGLAAEFGPKRVMNTPLAELGFTSMAVGMAIMGLRPVVEMQFADFISTAFDSIVQLAATSHYRWGAAVPLVIRAPSDGGLRSGPFHSQNPEAWFVHVPGLKVVAPATPADAKGLLTAAIRDNNPVIYFESKPLYRSLHGEVPAGEYLVPIGSAHLARRGEDLSIITYGAQVHQALAAARAAGRRRHRVRRAGSAEPEAAGRGSDPGERVQDGQGARRPLGEPAGRGLGAEVAALVSDRAFRYLDGPVRRLGGLDTPVPFSPPLEDAYRPDAEKIYREALALARF